MIADFLSVNVNLHIVVFYSSYHTIVVLNRMSFRELSQPVREYVMYHELQRTAKTFVKKMISWNRQTFFERCLGACTDDEGS